MIDRRTQVLAQRQQADTAGTQIIHGLRHLGLRLAEAQHQAALGEYPAGQAGTDIACMREYRQRLVVARTRITYGRRQPPHGFQVVRKNLQAGADYRGNGGPVWPEKSGVSASTAVAGFCALMARIQAA